MKLSQSMVCMDCNEVFEVARLGRCPHCGSGSIWPIDKWLSPPATRLISFPAPREQAEAPGR